MVENRRRADGGKLEQAASVGSCHASLRYAPAETRSCLRDWLLRYLPAQHHANVIRRTGPTLYDEHLLELILVPSTG